MTPHILPNNYPLQSIFSYTTVQYIPNQDPSNFIINLTTFLFTSNYIKALSLVHTKTKPKKKKPTV